MMFFYPFFQASFHVFKREDRTAIDSRVWLFLGCGSLEPENDLLEVELTTLG